MTDRQESIAQDISLRLPAAFESKHADGALLAREPGSGTLLTIFVKPGPVGVSLDRLHASAQAMLRKKYPDLYADGEVQPAPGAGWTGTTQLYRSAPGIPAAMRILVSCAILPGDAAQQRNLLTFIEVPDAAFVERLMFFRRFFETRLRVSPLLALVDIEAEAPAPSPEPPAVAVLPAAAALIASRAARPAAASVASRTTRPMPRKRTAPEPDEHEMLVSAARGQRTLAISILLMFGARGVVNQPELSPMVGLVVSTAVVLFAVSGVVKLCAGFGYSRTHKLVSMFLSTVPLLNIALWIYLSIKTTRRLRAAGHTVGLFGARP